VLGGGLAGGAGDADDGELALGQAPHDVPGELPERGQHRGAGAVLVGVQRERPLVGLAGGGPRHDDRGGVDLAGGQHGHGAGLDGLGGEVVAVDLRPRQGDEQAAGRELPGVELHAAGHLRAPVGAVQPAADDVGDLGQAEHDHTLTSSLLRMAAASSSRSENGCTTPPASWPDSCPLPARKTMSPGPASATAWAMASRRSPISTISPPSAGPTARAPASIAARMAAGSSERGLSSVTIRTSLRRAAASPIIGRLAVSRSPPQPSTVMIRPSVRARSASRPWATAAGLWA